MNAENEPGVKSSANPSGALLSRIATPAYVVPVASAASTQLFPAPSECDDLNQRAPASVSSGAGRRPGGGLSPVVLS